MGTGYWGSVGTGEEAYFFALATRRPVAKIPPFNTFRLIAFHLLPKIALRIIWAWVQKIIWMWVEMFIWAWASPNHVPACANHHVAHHRAAHYFLYV